MTDSSRDQFDAHAANYASSAVHQFGASLPLLLELAAPTPQDTALDVATGTGNTALALAPFAAHVTGLDVSPKMLEQARARAEREGIANASFLEGRAEQLPFADGSFTLVSSRHAPHHFRDVPAFLGEVRRVLRPGGRLVLADQITPQTHMQVWVDSWQRTRDPSHFRQRTVAEWRELAEGAGFVWAAERSVPYRLEFAWWTRMAGSSLAAVAQLRQHARNASEDVCAAMGLEFDENGEVLAHHDPMLVVRLDRA